ncbi:MAG: zf-TFIIB domain-containing protein [Dehalococcoidia bacterium]
MNERTLNCPRDATPLDMGREHDIEVDRCPTCNGAWYDDEELALLEATVADDDERRGMIDYAKRESELACPVCTKPMRAFNYRAYNLELDACTEEHGFWLDEGEANHVRDVMKDRVSGLQRSGAAQEAWDRAKRGDKGGGIMGNLRGLFGGRRG